MNGLLFVCQANVLRSPSAELLARWLGADGAAGGGTVGGAWQVRSAGMHALTGRGIDADAGAALAARGIDTAGHRAQQATPALVRDSALVLTFDTAQRTWVLQQEPGMAGAALTIRRAAALLAAKPRRADPLDHLRWDAQPYTAADDFGDPIGTGGASIARAVDEIERLLRVILPALGAVDVGRDVGRLATGAGS